MKHLLRMHLLRWERQPLGSNSLKTNTQGKVSPFNLVSVMKLVSKKEGSKDHLAVYHFMSSVAYRVGNEVLVNIFFRLILN